MARILIVDDEKEILDIVEIFLIKNGFEVIKTQKGLEAIDILKSRSKIDLIILDMKMPQMSGIDVVREMKKAGIAVPVVILSGSIDLQKDVEELNKLSYNENDILYKPIDLFELLEKVKQKLAG
jgi:two-component system, OmpR family, response regulator VanR